MSKSNLIDYLGLLFVSLLCVPAFVVPIGLFVGADTANWFISFPLGFLDENAQKIFLLISGPVIGAMFVFSHDNTVKFTGLLIVVLIFFATFLSISSYILLNESVDIDFQGRGAYIDQFKSIKNSMIDYASILALLFISKLGLKK